MFRRAGKREGGKPLPLGLQFHYIKWKKKGYFNFKVFAFWSQWRYHYQIQITRQLYTIKINYWNASGSGFPPSLFPALRNIGILHHKKAELRILLQHSVHCKQNHEFESKNCEIVKNNWNKNGIEFIDFSCTINFKTKFVNSITMNKLIWYYGHFWKRSGMCYCHHCICT